MPFYIKCAVGSQAERARIAHPVRDHHYFTGRRPMAGTGEKDYPHRQ
jgi:hypothetical protein